MQENKLALGIGKASRVYTCKAEEVALSPGMPLLIGETYGTINGTYGAAGGAR